LTQNITNIVYSPLAMHS